MKLLNLGCGDNYHSSWENVDFHSNSDDVMAYDLTKGIPFPTEYFDGVYSSHVLEHFKPEVASEFLKEIHRVLKTGAPLRIVVPDLENIVRHYLENIDNLNSEWMTIELLDQLTRDKPGGLMRKHLENVKANDRDFILGRMGEEAIKIWNSKAPSSISRKMSVHKFSWYLQKIREKISLFCVFILGGHPMRDALKEGLFRRSGEVHHWMYDRRSLEKLLKDNGFSQIKRVDAHTSQIPEFQNYQLDSFNGTIRKPDSLFMEARK